MEIRQFNQNGNGSFKALESDKEVGILTYSWDHGNTLILNHTEVDPEYEGQGIAKKLVLESVAFARQKNLKILPRCNYAKKVFERTHDIQDVLSKA